MLQYTTQIQTKNSNLRNSIGPKPGFFNNNKNISKKLIERERGGERADVLVDTDRKGEEDPACTQSNSGSLASVPQEGTWKVKVN